MNKPVFNPDFYRELAAENPFGLTLHWREVEAWFDYIAWPAYKTYGYTRHHRSVRRWWARCTMYDLDRARDAMDNIKLERAQEEQDQIQPKEQLEATPETHNALRKIMGGRGGEE
jgi:hypothetical protein